MAFAAPWMLLGLATVAGPIIIHLLDRQRRESVPWPALRFLRMAHQQTARRARIKNWLVLLLRCLLLILLFLALAMPYQETSIWAKPANRPTTAVLVIDNSYSMGYRLPDDTTRFQRAKQMARQQLARLSIDDEVALIVVNDEARLLTQRPTADHDKVRRMIRGLELSRDRTDLGPGLSVAFEVGQRDAAPDKGEGESQTAQQDERNAWREVLVMTDMQRVGWSRLLDGAFFEGVDNPLPVTVMDVSGGQSANRFIREATIAPQSSGGQLTLAAEAVSADVAGPGQVEFYLDDRKVAGPRMAPEGAGTVELSFAAPGPGLHSGRVELSTDRLPIDNTHHLTLNVAEGSRLLVVDGAPSPEVPRLAETYYLQSALELASEQGANLAIERITPEALGGASLGDRSAVILANVPQLDGSTLARLENFLRNGGNVLVTLGDRVRTADYNQHWSFLPATLGERKGDPSRRSRVAIRIEDADHPLFRGGIDLSATRFFSYIAAEPRTEQRSAEVLATFSDGRPAIIEGRFGDDASSGQGGRVLLMTAPIDAAWSNLPFRRAYLPLVDRFADHLTRNRVSGRSVVLGEPVRFTAPPALAGQELTITNPAGDARTLRASVSDAGDQAVVEYARTDQPGLYRVEAPRGFNVDPGFSVNLDPEESVLELASPESLREAFGEVPLRFVRQEPSTLAGWSQQNQREKQDTRHEYWPALLIAALAVFLTELLVANLLTRRASTRPAPTTEYLGRDAASSRRVTA